LGSVEGLDHARIPVNKNAREHPLIAQWRQIYRSAGTMIHCPIPLENQFSKTLDEGDIDGPRAAGILMWLSMNCLVGYGYRILRA
jgi:hypothetical protein